MCPPALQVDVHNVVIFFVLPLAVRKTFKTRVTEFRMKQSKAIFSMLEIVELF